MPLNPPAMILAANALRGAITHMQLHGGDPGAAGTANIVQAAAGGDLPRQAVAWTAAAADGDFGLVAAINFTGTVANTAVTWISVWSQLAGGTWYGNFQLTGDATANALGEYTVTALDLNGSAT